MNKAIEKQIKAIEREIKKRNKRLRKNDRLPLDEFHEAMARQFSEMASDYQRLASLARQGGDDAMAENYQRNVEVCQIAAEGSRKKKSQLVEESRCLKCGKKVARGVRVCKGCQLTKGLLHVAHRFFRK